MINLPAFISQIAIRGILAIFIVATGAVNLTAKAYASHYAKQIDYNDPFSIPNLFVHNHYVNSLEDDQEITFIRPEVVLPVVGITAYFASGLINKSVKIFIRWKYPLSGYTDDHVNSFKSLKEFYPGDVPAVLKAASKSIGIINAITVDAVTASFQATWTNAFAGIYSSELLPIKVFSHGLEKHFSVITSPIIEGVFKYRAKLLFESGVLVVKQKKNFRKRRKGFDAAVFFLSALASIQLADALGCDPFTTVGGGYISLFTETMIDQIYKSFHPGYHWVSSSGKRFLVKKYEKRVKYYHTLLPTHCQLFQAETLALSLPGAVRILFPDWFKSRGFAFDTLMRGLLIAPKRILSIFDGVQIDAAELPGTLERYARMRGCSRGKKGILEALCISVMPIVNVFKANPIMTVRQAMLSEGTENARIDVRKLTEYALNMHHPYGRHKAKLFQSILGFNQSNALELMKKIEEGVKIKTPILKQADQFGIKFTVDIPVTGPLGCATVRTGWIYRPGHNFPELTTLFVNPDFPADIRRH